MLLLCLVLRSVIDDQQVQFLFPSYFVAGTGMNLYFGSSGTRNRQMAHALSNRLTEGLMYIMQVSHLQQPTAGRSKYRGDMTSA
jgi:hypothetical protein